MRERWPEHSGSYLQIQPKTHPSLRTAIRNQPGLAQGKRQDLHNVHGGLVRYPQKKLEQLPGGA